MSSTPNLQLPFLASGQAQKHVTANEVFLTLDAVTQLSVISRTLTAPPLSPADGARYLVAATATGDWTGWEGRLAAYQDGAWISRTAKEGWLCWDASERHLLIYTGGAWTLVETAGGLTPRLLINGDFRVNQRGFGGGVLSAGAFGHDRWKAATGGANYAVSAGVITLAAGALEQVVEPSFMLGQSLAGRSLTISVEDPSAALDITFAGQSGQIAAGAGRRALTITAGPEQTGNVTLRIGLVGGAASFERVMVELGGEASAWIAPNAQSELLLCQRYFVAGTSAIRMALAWQTNQLYSELIELPVAMRATPTVATPAWSYLSGTWQASSSTEATQVTASGFNALVTASGAFEANRTYMASGSFTASAEP